MAGSDHPADNPVCAPGHPHRLLPRDDGAKEAPVRGHLQPQLPGGGRRPSGNGQRAQSASGGEADLTPSSPGSPYPTLNCTSKADRAVRCCVAAETI